MNKRLTIFVLPCLVTMSIVLWGIGCTSDEEKNALISTTPSSESTKPGPDSSVIIAKQAKLGSHTGSESTFSKAKEAFAEGNYELAKELTKKAILQSLGTVKDAKEGTYDQAKKKALPMLKEMWEARSKINEVLSSDEEDDEKGFGSERETVAGPEYEPELEYGQELALNSSSELGKGSEKSTDIFRETWDLPSNYPEPDQIPDSLTNTDSEGPEEPEEPEEPEGPEGPEEPKEPKESKEPEEPQRTCCGGYTAGELDAMYLEDEDRFWSVVWPCDLEPCL